jgi:hypothetical protein
MVLLGTGIGVVALIFAGLVAYQTLHWSAGGGDLQQNIEKYFSYSFGVKASATRESMGSMTRLEALLYWWEQHGLNNVKQLLIGDGLSASKSGSSVLASAVVAENDYKQLDKTSLSALLWDSGVVGTTLFLGALLSAYLLAGRVSTSQRLTEEEQAIVCGLRVGVVILVLSLPYTNTVMQTAPGTVMLFLVLGLIAYYYRVSCTKSVVSD